MQIVIDISEEDYKEIESIVKKDENFFETAETRLLRSVIDGKVLESHGAGKRMLTYEQNVKAILECIFAGYKDELIENACKVICTLKDTEEQKPKTGHWIYDGKSDLSKCSICGAYCLHNGFGRIETYYCPHCGAKMEGV